MALTPLTAFEHQPLPVTPEGGADSLSEAEADRLMLIAEDRPGFCTRGFRTVKLTEYCGLVNLGDRMLEILPKVGEQTEAGVGRGVLLRLLRHASDIRTHRQGDVGQASRSGILLDVFICAFFEEVLTVLKAGLLRRYVERDEDILAVRGTISLQRQLTTLANRTDLLACRFDDLTPDHRWNRLIKAALKVARPWIRSIDLQRTWLELAAGFEDVSDVAHPRALLRSLTYDRQANRYRKVIAWVERILDLLCPELRAGERPAPALLFDMNALFERVVENRVSQWSELHGFSFEAQDESQFFAKIGSGCVTRSAYRIRPDLVLRRAGTIAAIGDAKWKQPKTSKGGLVLPDLGDLYQLHAYAATYRCNRLFLVYPRSDRMSGTNPTSVELPTNGIAHPTVTVRFVDIDSDEMRLMPEIDL